MNEKELYNSLSIDYTLHGNSILVPIEKAKESARKIMNSGRVLLGWDALSISDKEIRPSMTNSIDYTSLSNSKFHGINAIIEHYEKHLDQIKPDVTHIEFIWDI